MRAEYGGFECDERTHGYLFGILYAVFYPVCSFMQ